MERSKMMQILVPGVAAAGVVILIGVLVAMSDWGAPAKGSAKGDRSNAANADQLNDSGMVDTLPPLDDPAWKVRPDGMRFWDVKEGEGDPCPKSANVTIHYTGWTLDGKVFDSSRKNLKPGADGAPANFPLDTLIKGWQEGIPSMKPGGIRRLKIPYEMAYGERGKPPTIPPRATLVFEVKLLEWR